jgi:hypothetical protein
MIDSTRGDSRDVLAPTTGPRRSIGLVVVAVFLALAQVAGVLATVWLLLPDRAPTLTYDGSNIVDPARVLRIDESTTKTLIAKRHGVSGKDVRCYYAIPVTPRSGHSPTDVDAWVFCGPASFPDGAPGQAYLRFELAGRPEGGRVALTSTPPSTLSLEHPSNLIRLVRPDGHHTNGDASGLVLPTAPAAAPNSINFVSQTQPTPKSLGSVSSPSSVQMLADGGGVLTVTSAGLVPRFGFQDTARSAPAGQKIYAAELTTETPLAAPMTAGISINGAVPFPIEIPSSFSGALAVVVPANARSVDLVVTGFDVDQRLSLVNGRAGKGNIAFLTRPTTHATLAVEHELPADYGDGVLHMLRVTASEAEVFWFSDDELAHPFHPNQTLLSVQLTYHEVGSETTFGFDAGNLTLTPTGGTPIRALNIADGRVETGRLVNVFVVPANYSTGMLTIGSSDDAYGVRIPQPYSFAVNFPR